MRIRVGQRLKKLARALAEGLEKHRDERQDQHDRHEGERDADQQAADDGAFTPRILADLRKRQFAGVDDLSHWRSAFAAGPE